MLEALGAKLRYGQVSLVAGAPGSGKSAFALCWCLRAQVPTLYFSADSDRLTLATRIGASITRQTTDDVELGLLGEGAEDWQRLIGQHTSQVWFSWDPAPTLDDIEAELLCYAAVTGQWPGLVVLDNLKNVWDGDSDEKDHVRFDRVIARLNEFAREYGSHVLILHHVTGSYEDGYTPIPLSGLLGKPSKDVTLALTLHRGHGHPDRPEEAEMRVCVVKNRVGQADPGGNLVAAIPFVPARQWFAE